MFKSDIGFHGVLIKNPFHVSVGFFSQYLFCCCCFRCGTEKKPLDANNVHAIALSVGNFVRSFLFHTCTQTQLTF